MRGLFSIVLAFAATSLWAQAYPQPGKPVRVLGGFAAGGGTDIQARIVAPKLAEALGTNVFVENKPGAGTSIAAAEVARSAPDGHTLLYTFNGTFAQIPFTLKGVPYDPVKDFTPITLAAVAPLVVEVHADSPIRSLRDLIETARANKGKLNYASAGPGNTSHLAVELFKMTLGVDMTHV
ncbi:MAG: Bug family tripartite tricarboxylate transporter substrate binding protein, partial [Burkholderiales bacterium]